MGPMLWKPEKPCARISGDAISGLVVGGLRLPGQSSLPRGTAPLAPVGGCLTGLDGAVAEQPMTPRRQNVAMPASADAPGARFMWDPSRRTFEGAYICVSSW